MNEEQEKMMLFILKAIATLSEDVIADKYLDLSKVTVDDVKDINDEAHRYINNIERW